MKKLLIFALAAVSSIMFSCKTYNASDYYGIWVNHNLDYLELNHHNIAIAKAYDNYLPREKYTIHNDTLTSVGKIIFCKKFIPCTVKFLLENKKIKALKTHEVSEYFFDTDDAFLKENDRFSIKPFDSLVVKRFELTTLGIIRLSKIKIDDYGKIRWSTTNGGVQKEHILGSDAWEVLNLEIMKIDRGQFKLWDEGESADDNFLEITIFRNSNNIKFKGSVIPFYYKMLRRIINDIEVLRIEERRN